MDRLASPLALLFARLGWEAQYYADTVDVLESVTLMGITAGVGLMRSVRLLSH